jgi:hypothetical protein
MLVALLVAFFSPAEGRCSESPGRPYKRRSICAWSSTYRICASMRKMNDRMRHCTTMQPKIARTPKASCLVKCRAAQTEKAWNVSLVKSSCFFCELTAILVAGRQCHLAPVDAYWHSMPWCWWCECEAELRALFVSACCEQTLCGSSQRERARLREGANESEHVIGYTNREICLSWKIRIAGRYAQ